MYLRKELYAKEAAALLRSVTTYRVVLETQIYRFFPGKEMIVKNLLRYLERQGRIVYCQETMRYALSTDDLKQPDKGMELALWVLLDFIDKVEFHTSSEFPAKIIFFADSDMYEIIYVPYDNEILVASALSQSEDDSKRIIIVDSAQQISRIRIPSVSGFCTVEMDGKVQYYKFQ